MRDRNVFRPKGHILKGRGNLLALESFMTQYWYAIAKNSPNSGPQLKFMKFKAYDLDV